MIGYKGKKINIKHSQALIHTSLLKVFNPIQQTQHYLNKKAGVGGEKMYFS